MNPARDETCWSVIAAAAEGDADARSVFARNYAGMVRSYLAHRWRGRLLADQLEDALQEVMVESLKPGGVLERADPSRCEFRSLLYGVVRNVARRFEERAARASRSGAAESVHLDELPEQAEALSRAFDRHWAQALIREALSAHRAHAATEGPDARRRFEVLRLRHDEGLSVQAIASRLGLRDVPSVHNDYRQARRAFTRHLRAVVAAHTGAGEGTVEQECRRLIELLSP